MDRLEDIDVADLRTALDRVEGKKPALRLVAAIAYKNGVTQTELARWFGVERKTIYNWLSRMEGGRLDEAVRDGDRPGRPRKLTDSQLSRLESAVSGDPREVGLAADAWTPTVLGEYVEREFDVTYSLPSCRRLLDEWR